MYSTIIKKTINCLVKLIGTYVFWLIGTSFYLLIGTSVFAQQNTTAAGGNATGAGGSVSYTIGQIDYITETGAGGNANQGVQQPALPCPSVTAGNVIACPGVPVNLVGTPGGGLFSISNPYLGPNTSYTYTYTDISIGCTVTSSPATVTNSVMTPANITSIVPTSTTATVTWTATPGATIYYLWYRPVSGGPWTTPTTAGTSLFLTGLIPNTIYECKIRNNNAACNQFGVFGPVQNFTTLNAPCATATTFITAFTTTNTTALLKWNGLANVAQYSVWYKKSSDASWFTLMFSGATTQFLLTGLAPNTMYDVRIRNRCNGDPTFSPFGPTYTFGTPLRPQEWASENLSYIKVFPNPTNDEVTIEMESNFSGKTTIKLLDITGRLIKQIQTTATKGLNQISIGMKELAAGNYTLQLIHNEQQLFTTKVTRLD